MFNFFFKHIDNSALIVFRILFGLLCFLESVGAILTGWVKNTLIDPKFTFSFIGFEWLQPLPGNGMYIYYTIMGIFGLLIMVGYKYRFSVIAFTVMWCGVYFMQKSSYNNHYYLLMYLGGLMAIQPANRYYSIDAKLNPSIRSISMPRWCSWLFIIQMFIVYTYGAIAKMYGDWFDTTVMELLMKQKSHYWLIGDLLQEKWIHYFLSYGGILFDGLVIPMLLWKPTRNLAFYASIFFHLFNSFVFQVGIFPYLSLAFILFFYDPKVVHRIFLRKKPFYEGNKVDEPKYKSWIIGFFVLYFSIHVALPLRHHFIKDDVLWTEEGHRMSWRMMLRVKHGYGAYKVVDKQTKEVYRIKLDDYLTKKQQHNVKAKPDFIWQFAQYLKKDFAGQGKDVSVYASIFLSVNGRPNKQLIDPTVDLAAVEWDVFKHSNWILPSK